MKRHFTAALLACAATLAAAGAVCAQDSSPQAVATPNPFGSADQPKPPAPKKVRSSRSTPKAGEFAAEADAKANCGGDTVVWVNSKRSVYHYAGTSHYGTTKRGAYMCEKAAIANGAHAAKNEKR